MQVKTGLVFGGFLILIILIEQSCLPYKSYEKSKISNCIFLDLKSLEIEKICNDGSYETILSLEVEVRYDTIKIINGKPSDSYTLYRTDHIVSFPYKLESSVYENKNKELVISMKTNVRDQEYGLRLHPRDWQNTKLAFTYYFNK